MARGAFQALLGPRIESRDISGISKETIDNEFRFPPFRAADPTGSPHFAPRESGSQSQRRLHVTQPCSSVPHSLVKSPRADACTHGRRHTSLSLKPSHSAALPGDPHGDPAGASGLSRRAQGTATGVARRSLRGAGSLVIEPRCLGRARRLLGFARVVAKAAVRASLAFACIEDEYELAQGFGLLELCESL